MNFIKKTKIVATIGPATSTEDVIEKMILSGVNVFRVNFSHANYTDVSKRIKMIRNVDEKLKTNTSILGDLQGPKLRVGEIEEGSFVNPGDRVIFSTEEPFEGNSKKAYMNYKNFPKDVSKGEKILLDDGKLIFEVTYTNNTNEVETKVVQGGNFKSKKGVNLPNTNISLPALTEKDIKDAEFMFTQDIDWIALSFVRFSQDIIDLQKLMAKHIDRKIPIIAKIEKPEAIENIDKIIAYADGLMVARGDLGVEVPAQEVPLIQKRLVHLAKKSRIPIIIATQMMETMIDSLTPTRAEVNDVANSVMDGADAIMLSGETSMGKYPCEVVKKIEDIIYGVEDSPLIKIPIDLPEIKSDRLITKSICKNAATIAREIGASAICTLTNSGYTGWQISSWRPNSLVVVFTSNKKILTQMNLLWGVKGIYYNNFESTDKTVEEVNSLALENKFIKKGDYVINLAAMPIYEKGQVNTLRITKI